jgi:hypothetical protein
VDCKILVTTGQSYIKEEPPANGFASIWTRFMNVVIRKPWIKRRVYGADLRTKVAGDTEMNTLDIYSVMPISKLLKEYTEGHPKLPANEIRSISLVILRLQHRLDHKSLQCR